LTAQDAYLEGPVEYVLWPSVCPDGASGGLHPQNLTAYAEVYPTRTAGWPSRLSQAKHLYTRQQLDVSTRAHLGVGAGTERCTSVIWKYILTNTKASGRVGLIIPTLNAGERWSECLRAVAAQTLRPHRAVVVDSASTDNTVSLAESAGFEVISIERRQFNHGGTRQSAAEHLVDCEIIVFLTQDAIPANETAFAEIVGAFADPEVAVAYGRQLPHVGATSIEAHSRIFNYGKSTQKKNAGIAQQIGTKAFFCSNSFAAYRKSVLTDLGGFRRDLILGEDMEFAARAIKAGYANLYCAAATVCHSHDYSLLQTLHRYFDLGAFDAENSWMREQFGSHGAEGLRFVASEIRYLIDRNAAEVPRALSLTFAKLLGYRLGLKHRKLPIKLKRKLSMSPSHWG
jgi:rhamnosyltransferase